MCVTIQLMRDSRRASIGVTIKLPVGLSAFHQAFIPRKYPTPSIDYYICDDNDTIGEYWLTLNPSSQWATAQPGLDATARCHHSQTTASLAEDYV